MLFFVQIWMETHTRNLLLQINIVIVYQSLKTTETGLSRMRSIMAQHTTPKVFSARIWMETRILIYLEWGRVQKKSAWSRRTRRLSTTRVNPPVPGNTASNGTSGRETVLAPSSTRMM